MVIPHDDSRLRFFTSNFKNVLLFCNPTPTKTITVILTYRTSISLKIKAAVKMHPGVKKEAHRT